MTDKPAASHTTLDEEDTASKPALNWVDKAIWAMANFSDGETRYNIYAVMVGFATSSFVVASMIYRVCWKVLGIVDSALPGGWWGLLLMYGLLGALPVYLVTHSAAEIATANLTRRARRWYTVLGFLICPISWVVFGLLLVWLE